VNILLIRLVLENKRLIAYPANKTAEALAEIEASPRCTSRALRLAKKMRFKIETTPDSEGSLEKYLEVI
jgi:hypothetical protein